MSANNNGRIAIFWIVVVLIFIAGTKFSSNHIATPQLQPPPPSVTTSQPGQAGMYSSQAPAQQPECEYIECTNNDQNDANVEPETGDNALAQKKAEIHATLDQAEALLTE